MTTTSTHTAGETMKSPTSSSSSTSLPAAVNAIFFLLLMSSSSLLLPQVSARPDQQPNYTPSILPLNMLGLHSRKPIITIRDSNHTCGKHEIKCLNGMCILSKWRCDDLDDCGDYSDEYHCLPNHMGCPKDHFDCGNGQCVSRDFVCDKENDCNNGADETDCPYGSGPTTSRQSCGKHQFRCSNGQCIPLNLLCNQETDCMDRSDEQECKTCDETVEHACRDPLWDNRIHDCIPFRLLCDTKIDCEDESDERMPQCMSTTTTTTPKSTTAPSAAEQEIMSHNESESSFTSISSADVNGSVHGTPDAGNNNHKLDSSTTATTTTTDAGTENGDDDENDLREHTVEEEYEGDEYNHHNVLMTTDDYEDDDEDGDLFAGHEAKYRCAATHFQCANGQCIDHKFRCDNRYHCIDGSDEVLCFPRHLPFPSFSDRHHVNSQYNHHSKNLMNGKESKKGINLKVYDTPQIQTIGNDVVFRCRDEGETRLPVKWSRGDADTVLSNRHKEEEGRLTIYEVTEKDSGSYVCRVLGSDPLVSKLAHLTVISRAAKDRKLVPEPVISPAVVPEPPVDVIPKPVPVSRPLLTTSPFRGRTRPTLEEFRRKETTDRTGNDCLPKDQVCGALHNLMQLVVDRKKLQANYLIAACQQQTSKGYHR